ncbi:MAG: protein kinase domain-containing protein [Saprospiraceae bacterium]
MPKRITLGSNNQTLTLENAPFASGGEGELYRILAPANYKSSVAKLYFKEKRTAKQEEKIKYLIANPPELARQEGHQAVIWLEDSAYENGEFLGFIMPFAKGAKLEILCSNKIPKQYVNDWKRFSLKMPEARDLRLKICFNIATAVYKIHKTQKYVLVDLKPDNIIIQPNGYVSIVDIDSVQVVENERLVFPARVATPEFSPPEYYGEAKPGKTVIFETWDRFGLAVIFYKLLFGIHPYAATSLPPNDIFVNLQDKIKAGLFVHSPVKKGTFKIIPPPHKVFLSLPIHIQNLFVRCFEYGHDNFYERPTANEWCWGTTPRPPLISMRKLPSMALPMNVIQYTPAISLSVSGGDVTIPNLQIVPPKPYRHKWMETNFRLPRIVAGTAIFIFLFWLFGRTMPFTTVTVFQLLSILATGVIVAGIDYYSLPTVKEKELARKFKKEVGQQKREKRASVNQHIRDLQRIPKAEQEVQNEFYQEQSKILHEERMKIDGIVSNYRKIVTQKDHEVIKLNQQELEKVQSIEANLLKNVDLEAVTDINFLPLPDKMVWIEQKIERPDLDDSEDYLQNLKDVLEQLKPLNETFEKERQTIADSFSEKHDAIKNVCETAYNELTTQVNDINTKTTTIKETLFKGTLSTHAEDIQKTNTALQEVKKEIIELEDLFQNFNSVSNTLLEYKHINFKEYLRQAYLFGKRKP